LKKLHQHQYQQFTQKVISQQPLQQSQKSSEILQKQQELLDQMTIEHLLDNISFYRCYSQTELIAVIHQLKDLLAFSYADATGSSTSNTSLSSFPSNNNPVKLIIIDSIAFPFRNNLLEVVQRNRVLNQLLQQLNEIAYEYELAVVLVNHMTTKVVRNDGNNEGSWKEKSLTFRGTLLLFTYILL
jgi:RecA/RadA recombinase